VLLRRFVTYLFVFFTLSLVIIESVEVTPLVDAETQPLAIEDGQYFSNTEIDLNSETTNESDKECDDFFDCQHDCYCHLFISSLSNFLIHKSENYSALSTPFFLIKSHIYLLYKPPTL